MNRSPVILRAPICAPSLKITIDFEATLYNGHDMMPRENNASRIILATEVRHTSAWDLSLHIHIRNAACRV